MMCSTKQLTDASRRATAPARRAGAVALLLALMLGVAPGVPWRGLAAAQNPPPPIRATRATPVPSVTATPIAGAAAAAAAHAAAPSAAATSSPLATPQPAASPTPDERAGVIKFLGETIGWYQQLANEERLAIQPAETLFLDDSRQMSLEIVKLAFQYARAEAALLKSEKPAARHLGHPDHGCRRASEGQCHGVTRARSMMARVQEEQNNLNRLKQQAEQLKTASAGAKAGRRAQLTRQLAIVQSQIELSQSRLDSYNALVQFETTEVSVGNQGTGLSGQIDALERGVPQLNAPAKGAAAASQAAPPVAAATRTPRTSLPPASDNGLLGTIETLIGLGEGTQRA